MWCHALYYLLCYDVDSSCLEVCDVKIVRVRNVLVYGVVHRSRVFLVLYKHATDTGRGYRPT
jgi:hypothetical protein